MPHYDAAGGNSGRAMPGTVELRNEIKQLFPKVHVTYPFGIYANRPPSEHAEGRAIDSGLDAGDPVEKAVGDALAKWSVENADRCGIQSVIWNRRVWGFGRWYWRNYSGRSPHTDHVHMGQNKQASRTYKHGEVEDLAQVPQKEWDAVKADIKELLARTAVSKNTKRRMGRLVDAIARKVGA